MVWFKVDDSFESHPKVKSIPKTKSTRIRAIGLWTLAGSWSASQLTDGFVPNYMLPELGGTHIEATWLVNAGLWLAEDDGHRFHDWDEWQPTKAKVEEERAAAKERMRVARERKKGTRSGDVRANTSERTRTRSENFANQRSVTPTRPDPTRPDPKEQEHSADKSTARKKPAVRLPADWQPTDAHLQKRDDGIDVQREADTFRAHAEANDRRCVNWNAAFTQWLLKARPSQAATQPHKGRAAQWLDLAQQMRADEDARPLEIGEPA
jgi:hypothetical protein